MMTIVDMNQRPNKKCSGTNKIQFVTQLSTMIGLTPSVVLLVLSITTQSLGLSPVPCGLYPCEVSGKTLHGNNLQFISKDSYKYQYLATSKRVGISTVSVTTSTVATAAVLVHFLGFSAASKRPGISAIRIATPSITTTSWIIIKS